MKEPHVGNIIVGDVVKNKRSGVLYKVMAVYPKEMAFRLRRLEPRPDARRFRDPLQASGHKYPAHEFIEADYCVEFPEECEEEEKPQ